MTFPFVLPNQVIRACDYYLPITKLSHEDLDSYPDCKNCKKKCFKARWYNNGTHRYGNDFFCLKCDKLVNLDGKIDPDIDRSLVCYDIDGNSIPFDDNTLRGKYSYTVVTTVKYINKT